LSLSVLVGCAADTGNEVLPAIHPASPHAPQAQAPVGPSETLAISSADPLAAPGTPPAAAAADGHDSHAGHGAAAAATRPSADSASQGDVYTCPHHPEVVSNHPGECPKCHMKLRKQAAAAGDDSHDH
jgi:hypothetical protein